MLIKLESPAKRHFFKSVLGLEIRDALANIALHLKGVPKSKPKGTPEGEGLYLTICSELSPNVDCTSLKNIFFFLYQDDFLLGLNSNRFKYSQESVL